MPSEISTHGSAGLAELLLQNYYRLLDTNLSSHGITLSDDLDKAIHLFVWSVIVDCTPTAPSPPAPGDDYALKRDELIRLNRAVFGETPDAE